MTTHRTGYRGDSNTAATVASMTIDPTQIRLCERDKLRVALAANVNVKTVYSWLGQGGRVRIPHPATHAAICNALRDLGLVEPAAAIATRSTSSRKKR